MSKKSAKKKTSTPKAPKVVKAPSANPNKAKRKKYTWTERQLMRCERAANIIKSLTASIVRAKPPGFEEYNGETYGLAVAGEAVTSTMARIAALPADFLPKRSAGVNRSGLEIGSTIGVAEEFASEPVFEHIPAALFESAVIVGTDGMQNWLVKCVDGVTRTIRKKFLERVYVEGEDDETPEEVDDEQLNDEDGE